LRAGKVKNITAKTLKCIIRENVTPDSHIMTDKLLAYKGWFSLLNRGINGTFHHVSEEHLDRYVGEFFFRYNNRKVSDGERTQKAMKGAEGKRLGCKEAVNEKANFPLAFFIQSVE